MTLANEEDCLDRIFWKVIGDAFPQEQRPRPGRISPLTQYTAEILAFEIDRYCGRCRRRPDRLARRRFECQASPNDRRKHTTRSISSNPTAMWAAMPPAFPMSASLAIS